MPHRDERILVRHAFRQQFGREPTRPEAQCVQAVSYLETGYGTGWKPPGDTSRNRGAIQAGGSWTGPTFSYQDTSPQDDGSNKSYVTRFRAYATDAEAVLDLVKAVYVWNGRALALEGATRGDTLAFSTALHQTHYYEGFGRTIADRIANHHHAVENACALQARDLGEAMPDGSAPPLPTLRQGDRGRDVAYLQGMLNGLGERLTADGQFGPKTYGSVVRVQTRWGLTADGIVGPHTWTALHGGVAETPRLAAFWVPVSREPEAVS